MDWGEGELEENKPARNRTSRVSYTVCKNGKKNDNSKLCWVGWNNYLVIPVLRHNLLYIPKQFYVSYPTVQ